MILSTFHFNDIDVEKQGPNCRAWYVL